MANITLTQSLLDTRLDGFALPSNAFSLTGSVNADIDSVIQTGGGFDSEPVISGSTYTYQNPTYSGEAGEYRFIGTVTAKYDNNNELISAGGSITGATIVGDEGTLTLKGTVKTQITTSKVSYNMAYKELSYAGRDGSAWSLKGAIALSYSYDFKTDKESAKYSAAITSLSSTDANQNNLTLSGNLKYAIATDTWSGYVTTMAITLDDLKLSVAGLKITYDELSDITELGTIADWAPMIMSGNDTIIVSGSDQPEGTVFGYTGNDKITGSSGADSLHGDAAGATLRGSDILNGGEGNDTLNGGGGIDQLTGGSGADTFVLDFSTMDFTSTKTIKAATVTDFKSADGDQLQLTGFDTPEVVTSIKALKGQTLATTVIYETSTGKFWYDADGIIGSGSPTLNFAKIIGVPADYFS